MSDSEEEGAFASADEGEVPPKAATTKTRSGAVSKKEALVDKQDGVKSDRGKSGASLLEGKMSKDNQQQQQRGKKKGKGKQPPNKPESRKQTSPAQVTDSELTKTDSREMPTGISKVTSSGDNVTKETSDSGKQGTAAESNVKDCIETHKEAKTSSGSSGKESVKNTTVKTDVKVKTAESPKDSVNVSKPISSHEEKGSLQDSGVQQGLMTNLASPEGQAISRDHKDQRTSQEENVQAPQEESASKTSEGGWSWGSWGSSILSAASTSVHTFTNQVGDGFTTIMDTVESSLAIPQPEQLAKDVTEPMPEEGQGVTVTDQPEKNKTPEEQHVERDGESLEAQSELEAKEINKTDVGGSGNWFSSWGVADLAKKVQDTGKSLASKGQNLMSEGFDAVENLAAGGIDVLETIGKKTYNTLSERDPAFRKTRDYLTPKGQKTNLSIVLREAKDQTEKKAEQDKEAEESRKTNFGALFDDYQGIAHLEALEMLSNQSEKKVHSLLNSLGSEDLTAIKPVLISIKEAFELNEDSEEDLEARKDEDFSSSVSQHLSALQLGTAPDKLNKVHDMVKQWIDDFDAHETHELESVKDIHQRSIQSLAELTSKGVEQFHKAGELVLMERDKDKDCTERAHSLARLTGVLCHEVGNLATKFAACLNKMADQTETAGNITTLVTNVYLEASNSSTYLQDAFQLLLPVLQHAALEHSIVSRQKL